MKYSLNFLWSSLRAKKTFFTCEKHTFVQLRATSGSTYLVTHIAIVGRMFTTGVGLHGSVDSAEDMVGVV